MYPSPQMHTELARSIHADRMREIEKVALVAAAVAEQEGTGEVNGVLSRLAALVPTARLSLHLASRKPAGGVA